MPVWEVTSFIFVFFRHFTECVFDPNSLLKGFVLPVTLLGAYVLVGMALHYIVIFIINVVKLSSGHRRQNKRLQCTR